MMGQEVHPIFEVTSSGSTWIKWHTNQFARHAPHRLPGVTPLWFGDALTGPRSIRRRTLRLSSFTLPPHSTLSILSDPSAG